MLSIIILLGICASFVRGYVKKVPSQPVENDKNYSVIISKTKNQNRTKNYVLYGLLIGFLLA